MTDSASSHDKIRQVLPADFERLLTIQIDSIRSLAGIYPMSTLQDWIDYIEKETANRYAGFNNRGYVNEKNELISFISWTVQSTHVNIECLYTLRPYRRKQIGRLLLREVEAGLKGATIHVRSTLNARLFYESNGYIFTNHTISRAGFKIALLEKNTLPNID